MNIDVLLEELYAHSMFGIKLGLENIENICRFLGNPEKEYKIIHLAGTNGKGSTSTTIEQILIEAGYKVGKYTSPHILKFNERIAFNSENISDEDVAKYYNKIKNIIETHNIKATFFEITTAMMFEYFKDKKADYVVLETGMGGRFDATNVVESDVAIITNVTIDHTEYLGNSIYEIAKEKAGIIKNTKNVIVADSNPEFLKAIEEETKVYTNVLEKYKDAKYKLNFENFTNEITINNKLFTYSLFGDYQFKNFLCAYELAKILDIDDEIIQKAAPKVVWECRFEVFEKNPLVILDGAHNLDGMKEVKKIIENRFKPDDVVIVSSILKDKDIKNMLSMLEDISSNIIITSIPNNPRGSSAKDIFDVLEGDKKSFSYVENIKEAYNLAKSKNKKITIVCGSFYLLSTLKEEINNENK